jgi:prepilin-type N-terminal cleavage/methylation domain-containing protein
MDKKAFSLLEMVMVIVVIGLSSTGLVKVMQQVVLTIHKPQVISTATALAEKEMERLLRISFAGTAAESLVSYTGSFSAYSHQTTVNSIDANDKVVVVTINHVVIGSLSLAFLRTNYQ